MELAGWMDGSSCFLKLNQSAEPAAGVDGLSLPGMLREALAGNLARCRSERGFNLITKST